MDQSALTFIAEQVTCLNRVRAQKPREVCHRRVADTTMTGTSVQRHTFGNVPDDTHASAGNLRNRRASVPAYSCEVEQRFLSIVNA